MRLPELLRSKNVMGCAAASARRHLPHWPVLVGRRRVFLRREPCICAVARSACRRDADALLSAAKHRGSALPRLIVVSNRVAMPNRTGASQAGGLAVAVRSVLKRHGGLWFGWTGTVSTHEDVAVR